MSLITTGALYAGSLIATPVVKHGFSQIHEEVSWQPDSRAASFTDTYNVLKKLCVFFCSWSDFFCLKNMSCMPLSVLSFDFCAQDRKSASSLPLLTAPVTQLDPEKRSATTVSVAD